MPNEVLAAYTAAPSTQELKAMDLRPDMGMNQHQDNNRLLLDVVQFRVESKRYSQIRAIISEASGESDTDLKVVLKKHHGIVFDSTKDDPVIHMIFSSDQKAYLREAGIGNPTFLQLIGTCKIFDIDRDRAIERFRRLMGEDDDKRKIIQLPN